MRDLLATTAVATLLATATPAKPADAVLPGLTSANRNTICSATTVDGFMACAPGSVWVVSFRGPLGPYLRVIESRCDFSKSVIVLEQRNDHHFIACQMK